MTSQDNSRMGRELRVLLECRHGILAADCADCRGITAAGRKAEEVIERHLRAGTIVGELVEPLPKGKNRHLRLSSVIGIGVGITVFGGLLFWQGGKLVLRLIKKEQPRSANDAGVR